MPAAPQPPLSLRAASAEVELSASYDAVRALVMQSKVEELRDLARTGRIDWARMLMPWGLIEEIAWKDPEGIERRGGLELLHLALEARKSGGTASNLFHDEVVKDLIRFDWPEAILVYLDAGFDPLADIGYPARSAIEHARREGKNHIAAMLQAHVARAAATEALKAAAPRLGARP